MLFVVEIAKSRMSSHNNDDRGNDFVRFASTHAYFKLVVGAAIIRHDYNMVITSELELARPVCCAVGHGEVVYYKLEASVV